MCTSLSTLISTECLWPTFFDEDASESAVFLDVVIAALSLLLLGDGQRLLPVQALSRVLLLQQLVQARFSAKKRPKPFLPQLLTFNIFYELFLATFMRGYGKHV